jgi:hypothetical protein
MDLGKNAIIVSTSKKYDYEFLLGKSTVINNDLKRTLLMNVDLERKCKQAVRYLPNIRSKWTVENREEYQNVPFVGRFSNRLRPEEF